MEELTATTESSDYKILGRQAWTSYFASTLLLVLVLAGLGFWMYVRFSLIPLIAALLAIAIYFFRFLSTRATVLYLDSNGVWVSFGVLPWNRGVTGVKWRDVDEAIFESGFYSWMCRSYTVGVRNRFKQSMEIYLTDVIHGDKAVMAINAYHQDLIHRKEA